MLTLRLAIDPSPLAATAVVGITELHAALHGHFFFASVGGGGGGGEVGLYLNEVSGHDLKLQGMFRKPLIYVIL